MLFALGVLAGILVGLAVATFTLTRGRGAAAMPDPYTYRYTLSWPPPPTWSESRYAEATLDLPVAGVRAITDPALIDRALRRDRDRIELRKADMAINGILEPFIVVVDARGRVTLKDGVHRLLAAIEMGWHTVPARLTTSPGISGWARPMADVLPALTSACPCLQAGGLSHPLHSVW